MPKASTNAACNTVDGPNETDIARMVDVQTRNRMIQGVWYVCTVERCSARHKERSGELAEVMEKTGDIHDGHTEVR